MSFDYTPPFEYANGWRDIVNVVAQTVNERVPNAQISVVWSTDSLLSVPSGSTVTLKVALSDPVLDAVTPTYPVDLMKTGAGTLTAVLDRASGQSVSIDLTASGGDVVVSYIQLRARPVPVTRMISIDEEDPYSVGIHGERRFQGDIPWANVNDAAAVADTVLSQYSERSPIVRLHVQAKDTAHLQQMLTRTVSDRITIVNGEMGLNGDFFIEQVSHTIYRTDPDKLPVHETVFGCDRILEASIANPFTFDKTGAGFDDGQFAGLISDNPSTIFIFDHATQGQFDTGVFGT